MKAKNLNSLLNIRKRSLLLITKCSLYAVITILAMSVIIVSYFDKILAFGIEKTEITYQGATKDELDSGADELPEQYRDIIYHAEYPLGLGIYDTLFSDSTPPAPDGELKIVSTDLSRNPTPDNVLIKNNSTYNISAKDFLTVISSDLHLKDPPASDEPLVLIYHTHGTEGYAEEGKTSYSPSSLPRSTDITKNVVAVGEALCKYLNDNGIPAIHCTTMFDKESYNAAYSNSGKALKEYLKKYPSIKYAFDVHRDALLNDTTVYKTLTYDESTPVAQLMFVVGTDNNGADHKNWKRCLSFAVNAQSLLTERLNNIVRPISIKKSSYNQQYPYIGMLIEVGTCANTLNEALNSVSILGQILRQMILSDIV